MKACALGKIGEESAFLNFHEIIDFGGGSGIFNNRGGLQ